ncbi:MAG: hypothetical protein U5K54_24395 [Cytophagales bacterium]|nr:hypothetical protein [Cytophagales bacterium]
MPPTVTALKEDAEKVALTAVKPPAFPYGSKGTFTRIVPAP